MYSDWSTSVVESATPHAPVADQPALRLVRPKDGPTLSVALATHKKRSELGDDFPPLALLCAHLDAELLVVCADSQVPIGRPASRHVKYVTAPADSSTTQMRELAMRECSGDIVVFLDDSTGSQRAWVDRVRASARSVAGRPSDDGSGSRPPVEWSRSFNSAGARHD
jgi:hypothetical protein